MKITNFMPPADPLQSCILASNFLSSRIPAGNKRLILHLVNSVLDPPLEPC